MRNSRLAWASSGFLPVYRVLTGCVRPSEYTVAPAIPYRQESAGQLPFVRLCGSDHISGAIIGVDISVVFRMYGVNVKVASNVPGEAAVAVQAAMACRETVHPWIAMSAVLTVSGVAG